MLFQNDFNVPLTGLPSEINSPIFVLLGIILSAVSIYIFPRILVPLFLKIKGKIYHRYENAYIPKGSTAFSPTKLLIRGIYSVLLMLGFLSIILPLVSQYTINLWLSEATINALNSEGVILYYSMDVLIPHICILVPFITGIWSVEWAMDEAGLMHFKFDAREDRELYEIEPIYRKYSSYIKGYAGISSIIFFLNLIISYAELLPEYPFRLIDMIVVLFVPFLTILIILPGYVLYFKLVKPYNFSNEGLPELKTLSEADILK